jgi:hypothetical protein
MLRLLSSATGASLASAVSFEGAHPRAVGASQAQAARGNGQIESTSTSGLERFKSGHVYYSAEVQDRDHWHEGQAKRAALCGCCLAVLRAALARDHPEGPGAPSDLGEGKPAGSTGVTVGSPPSGRWALVRGRLGSRLPAQLGGPGQPGPGRLSGLVPAVQQLQQLNCPRRPEGSRGVSYRQFRRAPRPARLDGHFFR